MNRVTLIALAFVLAVVVGAAEPANTPPADTGSPTVPRPTTWAQPVEAEDVPNLHKVSDQLYRSAQPTAEGMRTLKDMGIETIVNLRSFHSDRGEIGQTGLGYEHIYVKAWHPDEKEVIRFLQIVTNNKRTPVLVHCMHGADRTGAMCAIYRVAVQGWSKEEAVREMADGGFGFHEAWKNLVPWINSLDIDAIKEKSGIKVVTKPPVLPDADEKNKE